VDSFIPRQRRTLVRLLGFLFSEYYCTFFPGLLFYPAPDFLCRFPPPSTVFTFYLPPSSPRFNLFFFLSGGYFFRLSPISSCLPPLLLQGTFLNFPPWQSLNSHLLLLQPPPPLFPTLNTIVMGRFPSSSVVFDAPPLGRRATRKAPPNFGVGGGCSRSPSKSGV